MYTKSTKNHNEGRYYGLNIYYQSNNFNHLTPEK